MRVPASALIFALVAVAPAVQGTRCSMHTPRTCKHFTGQMLQGTPLIGACAGDTQSHSPMLRLRGAGDAGGTFRCIATAVGREHLLSFSVRA